MLPLAWRWRAIDGLVFVVGVAAAAWAPVEFMQPWRDGAAIPNPMGAVVKGLDRLGTLFPATWVLTIACVLIGVGLVNARKMIAVAAGDRHLLPLLLGVGTFTVAILFVRPAWERYWVPFIPMGIALSEYVLARTGSPWAVRYAVRGYLIVVGLAYFVYQRAVNWS
jgi:hypothetical protein